MFPFLFDVSTFHTAFASTPLALFSFLSSFQGFRLAADIFSLSFLGGLFVVPPYTFIQAKVAPSYLSQVIALSNIINAGFIVFASLASFCLLSVGFSISTLIWLTAIGQIGMTIYMVRILPDDTLKACLYTLLRILFRLQVNGLENYEKAGKRVILIANHTSYLDALLIAAILPGKLLFAINRFTAQKWWIKPFLVLAKVYPIDPLYPYALRDVIDEVKRGRKVLVFPEGRMTLTGSLMKIYEGPGMLAEKAEAQVLPLHLEGTQYTFFTHLKGKLPRKLFPKITITLLPPQTLAVPSSLSGKARRHALSEQLYDLMVTMTFTTSSLDKTLFASLIESCRLYGAGSPILEDISRKPLTYGQLLMKVFSFSKSLARQTTPEEVVGLLLPNTHALILSFWALHAIGRIPALLNYSSGTAALLDTSHLASLKTVYTSRQFIEKARLQEAIDLLKHNNIQVIYLEDEIKKIGWADKLWGVYGRFFPERAYKPYCPSPESPGVILFTSGSEDVPKGVPLTHLNLQANRYQLAAVVDFNESDTVFNVLPFFHAFGLTAGMILPLLSGIKTFHYISPLHYRTVAELIYDTSATILFGTDTFLAGYGRVAHAYDFHTLRFVFAGAEKLKIDTQRLWFKRFGLRLFEGYGTTETSPVLCVNTPIHYKAGTVGKFLPGLSYRLDPVEGIESGGHLWVKGPNVMRGYLPHPCSLAPNTWYDTGDIVEVDEEGYVMLKGRAKRFAKVGGEMLSLTAIEEAVGKLWPGYTHGVITQPDLKKGERLVLYTTYPKAEKTTLAAFWKQQGLSELSLPKVLIVLPSLPLLGSGKIDYRVLPSATA